MQQPARKVAGVDLNLEGWPRAGIRCLIPSNAQKPESHHEPGKQAQDRSRSIEGHLHFTLVTRDQIAPETTMIEASPCSVHPIAAVREMPSGR
jgi:hypothetical protein